MSKCDCRTSTGIHGGLTRGYGELDDNGFWEHPCPHNQPQWAVKLAAQISEYFQPDHRPIAIEAVSRILAQSEDVKRLVEAAEAALDELLDLHCEYNNGQDVFTYDDGRVCCLTGERIRRWQAALAPFGGGR